jgi:hypothetical protein
MAQGLVQQDCTAVVAMQFPISDSAATEFTGDFYGALADGLPVDQAVTSGRKALLAEHIAEWADACALPPLSGRSGVRRHLPVRSCRTAWTHGNRRRRVGSPDGADR